MNIINLIALIVVPILAVIIGQKLQDRAQKRNDKIQIFKILMMSRIYGWTTESVQAMNLIEIVFADDDTVCKQWKVYYDKLCVENPTETELQKIKKEDEKLLETMAKSLGYRKNRRGHRSDTAYGFCNPARHPRRQTLYVQEQPGGVHQ